MQLTKEARYLSAEDIYFPASGDCWAAFDVCSVLYTPIIYKTHTHTSSQPFISSSFLSSFPCCVGVHNDRDGFFRVSVYNTVGLRLLYHDCPYKYPECYSTHKLISQSVTLYTANRDEMAAPIKVRGWTYFRFPPNGPPSYLHIRSIRTEIVWERWWNSRFEI